VLIRSDEDEESPPQLQAPASTDSSTSEDESPSFDLDFRRTQTTVSSPAKECLLDPSRRMERTSTSTGEYRVDKMDVISESLAIRITSRACMIDVMIRRQTHPRKCVHTIGQAGLIQKVEGDFCIVTCVHNFMTDEATVAEPNREKLVPKSLVATLSVAQEAFFPYFETMNTPQLQMSNLRPHLLREETEEAERAEWKFGFDVAWGTLDRNGHLDFDPAPYSFEIVGQDFQYTEGLQIAMAIFTTNDPSTTNVDVLTHEGELTQESLHAIFGFADIVNIYTGSITEVNDSRILHDINTYQSFSGAVIFLLDQGQPPEVNVGDYGKAIAIHAGFHRCVGANIGFKINATTTGNVAN
jgi:hypothetical protein